MKKLKNTYKLLKSLVKSPPPPPPPPPPHRVISGRSKLGGIEASFFWQDKLCIRERGVSSLFSIFCTARFRRSLNWLTNIVQKSKSLRLVLTKSIFLLTKCRKKCLFEQTRFRMQSLLYDIKPAERGASRVCSTDSASAGTKGKHCLLIESLCQNKSRVLFPANRGLSLVEVLVGAAIGAVVMLGTAKTLAVALQSSNIVRTIVTEQELKSSLTEALSGDDIGTKPDQKRENCAKNLAPYNLVGPNKDKGVGTINTLYKVLGFPDPSTADNDPADEELISKGSFRDNIEVVEMELLDPNPTADGPSNPKSAPDSGGYVQRRLIVRYKKKNLGQLNTVGNKECSNTDKSGCYFKMCDVDYGLVSGATANPEAEDVHTCHSYNCFQYGEWTASKKYCVFEDCFNGGCLRWSDKKPKEEDKLYSYVVPYNGRLGDHGLIHVSITQIPSTPPYIINVRSAYHHNNNSHSKIGYVKGGCCTIKKYYINQALKDLTDSENKTSQNIQRIKTLLGRTQGGIFHPESNISDVERNNLRRNLRDMYSNYSNEYPVIPLRTHCSANMNNAYKAIDNMLHPTINASCKDPAVRKKVLEFFNFPDIDMQGSGLQQSDIITRYENQWSGWQNKKQCAWTSGDPTFIYNDSDYTHERHRTGMGDDYIYLGCYQS